MRIRQLSVSYLAEQDRILLRLNTAASEELRVWLTRRLMLGLWPLLQRLQTRMLLQLESGASVAGADEDLKRMLADFRKEQMLQEADFDTPYESAQALLPLGHKPLLVTDVDADFQTAGRLRLAFNEKLPGVEKPRSFNITLEPRLMQGLMHLLEQALVRSQWREPFEAGREKPDDTSAEEDSSSGRSRWLN